MHSSSSALFLLLCSAALHVTATAQPNQQQAGFAVPTVKLNSATFTGASSGRVFQFLGIPFAKPPTGNLRFQRPQPVPPYTRSASATTFGPACIQQGGTLPTDGLPPAAADYLRYVFPTSDSFPNQSEDCLTVNVIVPATATSRSKLPVAVVCGLKGGSSSGFDGTTVVERSISSGQPIIYVSLNYRLNGFGFLGSKEIKAAGAGNLGLQDQREALRWIRKYIASFGGDPTKVTIWGESAGSVSIGYQMIANGGNSEGLFRAAFMESGSPGPTPDITTKQPTYDFIVTQTGCSNSPDTLACLRKVSASTLLDAINKAAAQFSNAVGLGWDVVVDGSFLTEDAAISVKNGRIAKVPFVNGDCDDEGTAFGYALSFSISNNSDFISWVQTFNTVLHGGEISSDVAENIARLYPEDPSAGSPFGTGNDNVFNSEFKRVAAVSGDLVLHAPRRTFTELTSGGQPVWSFLSKRNKTLPYFGAAHGTDLYNLYGPGDLTDYFIRFVTTLNPNGGGALNWPRYTESDPKLLTLNDGSTPLSITEDTFRSDGISLFQSLYGPSVKR